LGDYDDETEFGGIKKLKRGINTLKISFQSLLTTMNLR